MGPKTDSPLLAKIINGSIAGMVGVLSTFPLDLVKTRLQNQVVGPNGEKLYTSMFDCFKKIYRTEGLRGLYRGTAITVILATPEKTIKLTANDVLRNYLQTEGEKLSYVKQIIAGAGAGILQMLVSTPLDLIKINMQISSLENKSIDDKEAKKVTARSIFRNLIHEKGVFGIYQGLRPTAIREIAFSGTFFPLYSALAEFAPQNSDGSISPLYSLSAGFGAGSFAAVFVTPIDVVKTRIQASLKQAEDKKMCIGIIDCIAITYRNEGITAFFKGGFCRMIVLAPLLGIAQCIYFLGVGEKVVKLFSS